MTAWGWVVSSYHKYSPLESECFQSSFDFPTLFSLLLFFCVFFFSHLCRWFSLLTLSLHFFSSISMISPITGMQKIVKSASPFVSLFFNSNYIYSNEFVKTCPACSDITLVQHGWTDFRAFLSQHVWFKYLQVFW